MEPTIGIEPMTSSLPRKCSTTELRGLIRLMAYTIKKADNTLSTVPSRQPVMACKLKQMRNFADHAGYKGLNMV